MSIEDNAKKAPSYDAQGASVVCSSLPISSR